MFNFYCRKKEYRNALKCYRKASSIVVFLELDEEQKKELFGDGGYRKGEVSSNPGLFNEARVDKAVEESCIKGNYDTQKMTYREVMEMWREYI